MITAEMTDDESHNEGAILGPDSESEASDEDDPDYVPSGEIPSQDSSHSDDSSNEAEEEAQTQCQPQRESKNGSHWTSSHSWQDQDWSYGPIAVSPTV